MLLQLCGTIDSLVLAVEHSLVASPQFIYVVVCSKATVDIKRLCSVVLDQMLYKRSKVLSTLTRALYNHVL